MSTDIGLVKALAKKQAIKYGASNFKSMAFKSQDLVAGTVTYTLTFINAGADVSTDIVFSNGKDGVNGNKITGANFVNNDMVFNMSDSTTITLANAKTLLKGSDATVIVDNASVEKNTDNELTIKGFSTATQDTVLIKSSTGNVGYLAIAKNSANSFSKIASMEFVSEFIQSGIILQGDWNASTNAPNITTIDTQNATYAWICNVAGTQILGGNSLSFAERDWVIKTAAGKYIKLNQSSISVSWGTIAGTITDQTDLVTYINNQITTKSVTPTGASTLTNKTLDDGTTIINSTDGTKKVKFNCEGIAVNTTRTLSIPNKDGTIAITDNSTGNLPISGFTKLGSDAPSIKIKKYTGNMPPLGQGIFVPHGLTNSKIINFSCVVRDTENNIRMPNSTSGQDIEYYIRIKNDSSSVWLTSGSNAALIAGRPFTITIMYEE